MTNFIIFYNFLKWKIVLGVKKFLKLLGYHQILIYDSFWYYAIENNPKNTKNYIAQKLQHGLRAQGRVAPQALRVLGDHSSMPWPAKPARTGGASYANVVYGGYAHLGRAHTSHMLLPPPMRMGNHPTCSGADDRHLQHAQSPGCRITCCALTVWEGSPSACNCHHHRPARAR